jgi:putative hydrolase of the HAD superfamily
MIKAVISDFGGVLTTSIEQAIVRYFESSKIPLEDLGHALGAASAQQGANVLFEMECGRLSEADFLTALGGALAARLGRPVDLSRFPEELFAGMAPNEQLIAYMRTLRARDYRMAICTNNVREWSARWQAMLPMAEIFEVVVDSSAVGARKPDPEIYQAVLRELGVDAAEALFIDDLEINCAAARQFGMRAVWFQDTEQAMAEIEAALDGHP